MIDQTIIWLENNYIISLRIPNNATYDTFVKVILFIDGREIILCEDCFGYLLKLIENHFVKIDVIDLDSELTSIDIGVAQNEYYHMISKELSYSNIVYLKEVDDEWIGSKFLLFESKQYSTWLFQKEDKIYLKITPLYTGHFEEEVEYSYEVFMEMYHSFIEMIISNEYIQQTVQTCRKMRNELGV